MAATKKKDEPGFERRTRRLCYSNSSSSSSIELEKKTVVAFDTCARAHSIPTPRRVHGFSAPAGIGLALVKS